MTDILEKSLNLISGFSKATKAPGKRNRTLETIPSALNLFFTKVHNDAVSSRKLVCENPSIALFVEQYLDSLKRRWAVSETRDEIIASANEHAVRLRFISQLNLISTDRFNISEFCAENLAFQTKFDEYALQSLLCQTSRFPDHFILFTNILRKRLAPAENNSSHSAALNFTLNSPLFEIDETREVLITLIFTLAARSRSVMVRSKCLLCVAKAVKSASSVPPKLSNHTHSAQRQLTEAAQRNDCELLATSSVANVIKASFSNSDSLIEFSAACVLLLDECSSVADNSDSLLESVKLHFLLRLRKVRMETLLERENVVLSVRLIRILERIWLLNAQQTGAAVELDLVKENESIVDWFVKLMNTLASSAKGHQHAVFYELLKTIIRCASISNTQLVQGQAQSRESSDISTHSGGAGFDWLLQRAVFSIEKLLHSQADSSLVFVALSCLNELLKTCESSQTSPVLTKSVRTLVLKSQAILASHVSQLSKRANSVEAVEKEALLALEILVRVINRQNYRAVLRLFESGGLNLRHFASILIAQIESSALMTQFESSDDQFDFLDRIICVFSSVLTVEEVRQVASSIAASSTEITTRIVNFFDSKPNREMSDSSLILMYVEIYRSLILKVGSNDDVDELIRVERSLINFFVDFLGGCKFGINEKRFCDASVGALVDAILLLRRIRWCGEAELSSLAVLLGCIDNSELRRQLSEIVHVFKLNLVTNGESEAGSCAMSVFTESSDKSISDLDFSLSFLDAIVVKHLENVADAPLYVSSGLRSKAKLINSFATTAENPAYSSAAEESGSPQTVVGDLLLDLVDQRNSKIDRTEPPATVADLANPTSNRVDATPNLNGSNSGDAIKMANTASKKSSLKQQQKNAVDELFLGVSI